MTQKKIFVMLRVYEAPGVPAMDVYLTLPGIMSDLIGPTGGLEGLYAVTPNGEPRRVLVKRLETNE